LVKIKIRREEKIRIRRLELRKISKRLVKIRIRTEELIRIGKYI
jgi:hypothetical protein